MVGKESNNPSSDDSKSKLIIGSSKNSKGGLGTLKDKYEKAPPTEDAVPFDKERAGHEVSTKRLQIAQMVLAGLGILFLISLGMLYCFPIDPDDKREILVFFISSLFSTLTLIIGFVAGSSIDNK